MNKFFATATLLLTGLALLPPVVAFADDEANEHRDDSFAIAVYGDAPYGCKAPTSANNPDECPPGFSPDTPNGPNPGDMRQIEATPAFIEAVNRDPKVRLVLHTGDIHSGSTYCTLAYDQTVLDLWSQFKDPLVYTPGDNEWADCQKSKEGGGVTNTAGELRGLCRWPSGREPRAGALDVLPRARANAGRSSKRVISQAQAYDPAHPADAEYVENVMWEQSKVCCSSRSTSPAARTTTMTSGIRRAFGAMRSAPQIQEVAQRTAADLRWLDTAFATAKADGAKAVVITEQADMWDLDGTARRRTLANYEPFIAGSPR